MTPTAQALAEVLAIIAKFDAWQCTGDELRCSDGNGCECAMVDKDCPPVYDVMHAFFTDHGPALLAQLGGGREVVWKAGDRVVWTDNYGEQHRGEIRAINRATYVCKLDSGMWAENYAADRFATPTEPAQAGRE